MPQKSTFNPGRMTSGTVLPYASASTCAVGRQGAGPVTARAFW